MASWCKLFLCGMLIFEGLNLIMGWHKPFADWQQGTMLLLLAGIFLFEEEPSNV
jgi:hypothetical protein